MLVGAKELGCTIFSVDKDKKMTVNFGKDVARKLWDNYYIPFVKGYFGAAGVSEVMMLKPEIFCAMSVRIPARHFSLNV